MNGGIFWLASYPKSGNTWTRTFLNALMRPEQGVDINKLNTGGIASSRSLIENALGLSLEESSSVEIELLRPIAYRFLHQQAQQPEYIKIHDAYVLNVQQQPLFPADAAKGVLYIVRHPYDVAVSFANHNGSSLQEAVDIMCRSDYRMSKSKIRLNSQVEQRLLSWSEHVRSWLDSPHRVHLMRYEDMQHSSLATFSALASFLEIGADISQIQNAIDACHFNKLKEKELQHGFREKPVKAPQFFRSGKVGEGAERLNKAQKQQLVSCHLHMMQRLDYVP
ncbi:sulfotransferase domain-containing protein [Rheinheimera sp. UJ63]|uniref:sulfotransferase domain-containing protein n=1 Tax=Rheinheimera sp. UJ63 TaxID=2910157 RepID=UPI001F2844C1|nr:sulfotransferase domain-containing protein [Rheinheimera sp. UJ63]MCF4009295.1 sulfotransferase domain-containing protein [Rheinheimera sp. UJ63]